MIYFITESYLKTQTPITANVDVNDVVPYIKTQSDMRVQPILGTYFYNYMLTGYNAQTLNNDEETLVTYIQPVVAWRSAEDAVFGLSYQLKNKGIQQQFGDYSSQVTQNEVVFSARSNAFNNSGSRDGFLLNTDLTWLGLNATTSKSLPSK